MSRDTTFAISEAQSKLDEIRNSNYDLITTDYISGGTPGNTFETTQPTGIGSIYINDSNPDLFVKIFLFVIFLEKECQKKIHQLT